ncbi:hypothetical protein Salmuc_04659 [Salipiger mucosus DSM 16094]|uniref:Uncharacterized protein n=2 Tax=Salipiger mucosus TaxID=263378 RepID=S9QAV5_9RHOB|nr:hypothetical protein Salmuc_04659 [Salipiger mucosus DSM 16094]
MTYEGFRIGSGKEAVHFDALVVEGDEEAGPVTLTGQGVSAYATPRDIEIETISVTFDPDDMAALREIERQETNRDMSRIVCDAVKSGLDFSVSNMAATLDGASPVSLGDLNLGLEAKSIAGRCVDLVKFGLQDFLLDMGEDKVTIGNASLASLQLLTPGMLERETGITFQSDLKIADVAVDLSDLPAPVTLDVLQSSGKYDADSAIPLARAGLNDLMATPPGAPWSQTFQPGLTHAAPDLDPAEVWNAIRQLVGSGYFSIGGLKTDLSDFEALPPSSPIRGPLQLDVASSSSMKDGALNFRIRKDADPLATLDAELELHMGAANDVPDNVAPDAVMMRLPLKFGRFDVTFDEHGLDQVLSQMTGQGIEDSVLSQLPMLPDDQKILISDWIASAMGKGNHAHLVLQPDSPQLVQSIGPMLFGDWAMLADVLNARTVD